MLIRIGYIWLRTDNCFALADTIRVLGFGKCGKSFWTTVRLLNSQEKFYGMMLNENSMTGC
jgi:hypothetical protein